MKTLYFNGQLRKYQNNVKKTWDVIKEVIGSTKPISHTLPKRLIINRIWGKSPTWGTPTQSWTFAPSTVFSASKKDSYNFFR